MPPGATILHLSPVRTGCVKPVIVKDNSLNNCIRIAFLCVLACRRHGLEVQQDDRLETALGKAIQGDQMAFAEIVREHQRMVFSIAYHFLRNNPLAEELAQEVFLHLYQNLSSIQSPAHLKYWLRRVAAHRCIDQGRRQKFRQEVALEDVPEPAMASSSADPMISEKLQKTVAS